MTPQTPPTDRPLTAGDDRPIEDLCFAPTVRLEPMRITLCGSTKFRKEYELWNKRLSLAGFLVYSVSGFGHSGDHFTAEQKQRLDLVHLAKIDASHAVVVIDVGGYIGESTAKEIARAKATGKDVYYIHGDPVVWRLRTGPDGPSSQRYRAFDYAQAEAALASPPVSERERGLEGALREIEAMCPATCETSLAHDMAQIASEALTAQPAGEGK